jgi:carboxyl-terminal processing protease
MNREKLAWVVSVVLVGVLAFQLPGSMATRDDDYQWVGTLVDIHRRVADSYVEPINEDELRQGAIKGLLEKLDPYTVYVPPAEQEAFDRMLDGSFKGVGIQLEQDEKTLEIQVITPIEGSPAFKAGVMAGDVIEKVNGEPIGNVRLPDVIKKIAGPLGSPVTLTVRHLTGEVEDLTMTRQEIIIPTLKGHQRKRDGQWDWFVSNDPKVAYVRLTQFTPDCYDKMRAILEELLKEGMQGLILDLRFNPGGRLDEAKEVVDLFVESGTIVVTKGRNRPEEVAYAKPEDTLPHFPMAVLVNEHSASASEIVAGSLKDNKRALVVGTRTYGKGSVQELIPLDGNKGELKLTVAYYYLPSGRLVHKKKDATDWGVEPHITVNVEPKQLEGILINMDQRDRFARPETRPATTVPAGVTTAPATQATDRPTTLPVATTGPTDPQLDAAVSTLIGHIVLAGEREVRK